MVTTSPTLSTPSTFFSTSIYFFLSIFLPPASTSSPGRTLSECYGKCRELYPDHFHCVDGCDFSLKEITPPERYGHVAVFDATTSTMYTVGGKCTDGNEFGEVWALQVTFTSRGRNQTGTPSSCLMSSLKMPGTAKCGYMYTYIYIYMYIHIYVYIYIYIYMHKHTNTHSFL
jgi:hypothetical protein